MNKKVFDAIKQKQLKLLPVDQKVAKRIKKLCVALSTNAVDVVDAATKLLELSLSREVSMKEPNSNVQIDVKTFKDYEPLFTLDKKHE